jgi:serine/threonine protein kinase
MKIESVTSPKHALEKEIFHLSKLQDCPHVPRVIESGFTTSNTYVVLELLGPSVSALRHRFPKERFSLPTALRLSLAMLQCIRAVHARGVVHGDVKPSNFLVRLGVGALPVVLIDFGLSKRYIDPGTGERLSEGPKRGFRGTTKYASLNVHRGHDQSPRDDLIAWLYSTVELVDGKLPWTGEVDSYMVRTWKASVEHRDLVRNLPKEFCEIARYLKSLTFSSKVNYHYLLCLVSNAVRGECFAIEEPYDWEGQKDGHGLPRAADYANTIPSMELDVMQNELDDREQCSCSVA